MLQVRLYVGYMLTAALSGATMMACIANSSYVLQVKGLRPLPFALFFRLHRPGPDPPIGRQRQDRRPPVRPRTLIGFDHLATLAVAALTVGVFALDTPCSSPVPGSSS